MMMGSYVMAIMARRPCLISLSYRLRTVFSSLPCGRRGVRGVLECCGWGSADEVHEATAAC
jgi:hypothetical protein